MIPPLNDLIDGPCVAGLGLARDSADGQLVLRAVGAEIRCGLVPFQVRFGHTALAPTLADCRTESGGAVVAAGQLADGGITFSIRWHEVIPGVFAMDLVLKAVDPEWAAESPTVVLLEHELKDEELRPDVGWREVDSPAAIRALRDRPPEEGGGFLPPYGYPVFSERAFFGIAHPMGCAERGPGLLRLLHHPQWEGGEIHCPSLLVGLVGPGSCPRELFARYFEFIRLPRPDRAIVEINTFWTDVYDDATGYSTDLPSYRRMAREWSRRVLQGKRGLVTHFLLDAGWQNTASLYRPQDTLGGPADAGLIGLADEIRAEGFRFGLWFTLNGPIGIDINWARAAGFRVSNRGAGAGYASVGGKLSYVCLTDRNWEEQLARRLEQLIASAGVDFMKGDWDNDAVEDPALDDALVPTPEHLREAIANAMIRIYGRMHGARPGFGLRGAWWPSPWWLAHVDNTHLPNSGDMESTDLPSLTQRDAGLTSRDAVFYHVMRRCRTPVGFDVLVPHEFAHSRRNPVADTATSWINNLIMWLGRGNHYLQIYAAPYDIHGDRAWALREALEWFRAHEDLLWKAPTRMVGGDPGRGGVYGYLHDDGGRQLLVVRNPLAHPQPIDPALADDLDLSGWQAIYPVCLPVGWACGALSAHEIRVLVRGFDREFPDGLVHRPISAGLAFSRAGNELRHATPDSIPDLHRIPFRAEVEKLGGKSLAIHAALPDGLESAEIVLRCRSLSPGDTELRAGLGRYPDPTATFPVGVTAVRANVRQGFAQRRLRQPPCDPSLVILRVPIGTGGEAHAFLDATTSLPQIEAGWIEAVEVVLPIALEIPAGSLPPSPPAPPTVLCQLDLP